MSVPPVPPPDPAPQDAGPQDVGPLDLVIVSGLSGSGKTTALRALEDAGYLAVDNLAPELWAPLCDLASLRDLRRVAVCTDARTRAFLTHVEERLDDLRARVGLRLVFLEADDEVLLARYNLTRRAHPLGEDSLLTDFARERALLGVLRERADVVLDTTELAARDLAARVLDLAGRAADFDLRLLSFGFKHAPPRDADLVLDVRGFPNPHYVPSMRHRTGMEADVAEHVFEGHEANYARLLAFVRDSAELARASGRRSYQVAVGCTGGQHRSVAVVERLARELDGLGARVVEHRDVAKNRAGQPA